MTNRKIVLWIVVSYSISLTLVIAYGLYTYGHLKGVNLLPNISRNTLEQFIAYKEFLTITSIILGTQIGTYAALLGNIYKRLSFSFISILSGIAFTTIVYLFLPRLFFPYGAGDHFQAWLVWLTTGLYIAIIVWLIVYSVLELLGKGN